MREFFGGWRAKTAVVLFLVAWTQWMTSLIYPDWYVIIPLLVLAVCLLIVQPRKAKSGPTQS